MRSVDKKTTEIIRPTHKRDNFATKLHDGTTMTYKYVNRTVQCACLTSRAVSRYCFPQQEVDKNHNNISGTRPRL